MAFSDVSRCLSGFACRWWPRLSRTRAKAFRRVPRLENLYYQLTDNVCRQVSFVFESIKTVIFII